MKYKLLVFSAVGIFILIALGMSWAGSFNPGDYPLIYRSAASPNATPSIGSGVIYGPGTGMPFQGGISLLSGCEFINLSAATQYYTIYDSATVATQSGTNQLCVVSVATNSTGSCTAGTTPSGPAVNGGMIAQKGLTWGVSSQPVPGPTTGGMTGANEVICTYKVR